MEIHVFSRKSFHSKTGARQINACNITTICGFVLRTNFDVIPYLIEI